MTLVDPAHRPLDTQQVVVAEDDCITQRLLACWLEDAGYQVICADNGRQALAAVMRNRASVLVTDWNMPEMTGYELCRQLRASEYRPYPYIIMATARESHHDVEAAIEAGADDYLVKPIQHGDLIARIKQAHSVLQRLIQYVERMETDELTGLLNRRRFEECLAVDFEMSSRNSRPLSCILADLDWFKQINDRWGHGTGDRALQLVGQTIREVAGDCGYACRFGGDEFCLLLPERGEQATAEIAEQIRERVSHTVLVVEQEQEVSLSMTLGVAALRANLTCPTQLIDAADEALLAAKRCGRNRVFTHGRLIDHNYLTELAANTYQAQLVKMKAADIMTTPIVVVSESDTLRDASDLFLRLRVTSVPVVNESRQLIGLISENHVLAAIATVHGWDSPIRQVMARNAVAYDAATPLNLIWQALDQVSVRRVVIVDGGVPLGVISRGTMLRWLGNWGHDAFTPPGESTQSLQEFISRVTPDLVQQLQLLGQHRDGEGSVVARTLSTVSRVQDQLEELLTFCQVNHRFDPRADGCDPGTAEEAESGQITHGSSRP
jgi:diguanylate cyclase (GGDEF)-like protein